MNVVIFPECGYLVRMSSLFQQPPIIYGEAMVDVYPDGRQTLGGAPFNVAWHLQGLGLRPYFISRFGDDAYGQMILQQMQTWGMRTDGVQWDKQHPTGHVFIDFNAQGEPQFRSASVHSYDFIDIKAIPDLPWQQSLFYHGTLTSRSAASHAAVMRLMQQPHLRRLIDLNLRPPFWRAEVVHELLQGAYLIKFNEHEHAALSKSGDLSAQRLHQHYGVPHYFITAGAAAAQLFSAGQDVLQMQPPQASPLVNAVGAGDAFCAAVIYGLYQQTPWPLLMQRALAFATAICELSGTMSDNPAFYQTWQQRWQK